jgi:hypothetical protein
LDQFRASSPYQVYQSTLRQYSPLPPEVYEFDHIFPGVWLRIPQRRLSLLITHFSASKSQGKDQNIHKIKALEPKVAVMPRAQRATGRLSAHVSPSLPLWGHKVADDTSREGETKVFLTVYFWRDVEKEHHFKHVEKTRGKTQYELAEQELEDFGAESWTEVHWLKQNLPKFSN